MRDIDLCSGVGCPLKGKCKRFLFGVKASRPGKVLWWVEPQYDKEKKTCSIMLK